MKQRQLVWLAVLLMAAGVLYFRLHVQRMEAPTQAPAGAQPTTSAQAARPQTGADLSLEQHPESVVDANGMLGMFAGHLGRVAETWPNDLGVELQIVSANLPETGIEAFASELFQARRIGVSQPNGGLLILFDGHGGRARIEVSYELEQAYPDAFVGRVAEQQLAPYAGSRMAGMAAMDTARYLKDFAFVQAAAGNLPDSELIKGNAGFREKLAYLSGGAGASVDIAALVNGLLKPRPVTQEAARAYRPGATPSETVEALIRVWKDQVPNADLDLYTPGTRLQKAAYPYAPFEVAERLGRLQLSGELIPVEHGEFAVVDATDPVTGFAPLLLKRIDGLWRVDEAETWKNLFYDETGGYFLKNSNTPYAFGLASYGAGEHHPVDALPVNDHVLEGRVRELRARGDALARFELGELLFRNAFAAVAALGEYEAAVKSAPNDPLFRSTLADRYQYLGMPEMAIPHLQRLGAVAGIRLAQAYATAGQFEHTEAAARKVLKDNPHSYHASAWLDHSLRAREIDNTGTARQLEALLDDPEARFRYVRLTFDPERPVFDNETPIDVGGTTVHGHSEWSVVVTNFSKRPVRILRVHLNSLGTTGVSGLGDIKDYWTWRDSGRVLGPGESNVFNKTWGFTVKTGDQRMSYLFNICWQGVNEAASQCEQQLLHLATASSVL